MISYSLIRKVNAWHADKNLRTPIYSVLCVYNMVSIYDACILMHNMLRNVRWARAHTHTHAQDMCVGALRVRSCVVLVAINYEYRAHKSGQICMYGCVRQANGERLMDFTGAQFVTHFKIILAYAFLGNGTRVGRFWWCMYLRFCTDNSVFFFVGVRMQHSCGAQGA